MSIPVFNLPELGFEQVSFELIVPRSANRMEGRRTEARTFGTPYWQASYLLGRKTIQSRGQLDAWIRKVASRGGVFRAYDPSRPRPVEFLSAPLTWTPDLTSITNAGRTVGISGVPANAQFRDGDYVAFKMASDLVVSLHTITADAKANSSGVVSLTIDAALDTQHFTTASLPIFEKPYCLMQPSDWSGAKSPSMQNPSFSAQEVFFYEP